jgi:hypothetical protein
MRILLLQTLETQHLYSAFSGSLCAALVAHGVEAEVFDAAAQPDGLGARLVAGRYDAVISFNSFAGGAVLNGTSIYDVIGARFLGWHLDHPIYVSRHIANRVAGRRSVYPNRNHLRFVGMAGFAGATQLMLPGADLPDAPVKAYAERRMDVFVAATWNGVPERSWEALEDSPAKRLLVQVTERMLADRESSVIDAYLEACADLGFTGLKMDEGLFGLLRAALTYVRHLDRFEAVMRLAQAGLRITVCGSGWEALLGQFRNVRLLPSMPFVQARRLYGEAKVSVNLNAGNGGCERVTNAMVAGSCVVSDFNSTLAEAFPGQELSFFERGWRNGIAEVVAELLEGGKGEAMAARGQARAMDSMLWTHRVEPMLALLAA